MLVELGVLDGQDGLHDGLGDLVEGDGLTVLVTVQGGQQRAVGREDLGPHGVAVERLEVEGLRVARSGRRDGRDLGSGDHHGAGQQRAG